MAEVSDEVLERERAVIDLEDIQTLKGTEAFQRYFVRRVTGMVETKKEAVLHDLSLTPTTLWAARLEYLAIREVSVMLLQDESSCRRMLTAGEGSSP